MSSIVRIDDAVRIFREYSSFPCISTARLNKVSNVDFVSIYSEWTQGNVERMQKTKIARTDLLRRNGNEYLNLGVNDPHEISDILWSNESPNGKYRATVRCVTQDAATKQYLEIWNGFYKLLTIDVAAADKHREIYSKDNSFDCFDWSPSSEKLLYLAEKKVPKPRSYFSRVHGSRFREKAGLGDENVYRDNWGETMTNKSHSVLCVLDIETETISVIDGVPGDVSPGQGFWCPDDSNIIFIGWKHEPYRLGLLYQERECDLYHMDLNTGTCRIITQPHMCIRSPSLSPDKTKISFLQHKTGGPLSSCNQLAVYDVRTQRTDIVVDIVHHAERDDFQGLFASWPLPKRYWAKDNKRLILHSSCRSKRELFVIDTDTGIVSRMTNDRSVGTWVLNDVYNDIILATYSSPNVPDTMVFGILPPEGDDVTIAWHTVDPNVAKIEEISWTILQHVVPHEDINWKYSHLDYESILIQPTKSLETGQRLPLVVYPHGGPHMVFPAMFNVFVSGLCRCGFAVLVVNYRGSTGFGQDSIDCFVGNFGVYDVIDVYNAARSVIDAGIADENRILLFGGSYGGTLNAYLLSRFPNFSKAAAFRNCVFNMAMSVSTSDMTDWFYIENGLKYEKGHVATDEEMAMLYRKSPIRDAKKVKTPVLLLLGAGDKRVNVQQAEEYYKTLRANNCETRMLVFEKDAHPLTRMETEADLFMNVFTWYKRHI